jgi:hypothetical protein
MQTLSVDLDRYKARALYRDVDLAWLAGLIDGEGCFHIRRAIGASGGARRISPSYRFSLLITMCSRETIQRVHELARIGFVTERKRSTRWSVAWTWWCGPQARSLILALRPYLKTKREEADISLRFLALPATPPQHDQSRQILRTPDDICTKRALLWDDLRRAKPTFRFREDDDPVVTAVFDGWRKTDAYRSCRYGSCSGEATLPGI